jgi:ubiquinone biosynthesis UbiH/UbiF/VisC/COQ6 family hydroxylase
MRQAAVPRIVIVGAGPVGLAIAAQLSSGACTGRFDVRVFDAGAAPRWSAHEWDLRVYALSRASQRLLESLGLWAAVVAHRASPYRRMHVWEGATSGGPHSLDFDCAALGEPDLGHIVEDNLLRRTFYDYLMSREGVSVLTDTIVANVRKTGQGMTLQLASGDTASADLLIAADGGASHIRELLDLPVAVRDYGQHAVVTHVVSELPHNATALQRFLPGGPLAFLPLTDGRSSIVWSLPSARAAQLTNASDDEFVAQLQIASGGALGRLGPCSRRVALPLHLLHALDYTRPGLALVGDAAHCVHPLAGQGMNLGLLDAVCLAEELERACDMGMAVGDAAVLRRYERRRKGHNVGMMLAFDSLDRIFRLPGWAAPVRGLGLALLNRSEFAKRSLMWNALGLKHTSLRVRSGS